MSPVPAMRRDTPAVSQDGAFLAINAMTSYRGGVRRRLGLDEATNVAGSGAVLAVRAVDATGLLVIAAGGTWQSWDPT